MLGKEGTPTGKVFYQDALHEAHQAQIAVVVDVDHVLHRYGGDGGGGGGGCLGGVWMWLAVGL